VNSMDRLDSQVCPEYTKCIGSTTQPADNTDLVYLFNTSQKGKSANVYYRRADESNWTKFDNNFPAGMKINIALPFYRDSKIRVAGGAGVWESPMQEENFTPIVNPWCQKKYFNCKNDTVYFDDHSMLNHAGATWHWEFNPEPQYVSSKDVRNPVVVFGDTLSYDVTLTVTVNNVDYSNTIEDMVSFTQCPSLETCNNPTDIPKDDWQILHVDSEEPNRRATYAIDGNPETFWHTEWSQVEPDPGYPHEIRVDMGNDYIVSKFTYLPRQAGSLNGTVKNYEVYVSNDKNNWGNPVLEGTFARNRDPKVVTIDPPVAGRYFRFVGLSEVNGNPWASAAEFSFVGCYNTGVSIFDNYCDDITAFPVPAEEKVNISLFAEDFGKDMKYSIYSVCGKVVKQGILRDDFSGNYNIDVSDLSSGVYLL